jgi:outer membrane protein TolC
MWNCAAPSSAWHRASQPQAAARGAGSHARALARRRRDRTGLTRTAALLDAVQAAIPPLETEQRAAMYALAVLLAEQPGGLVAELSPPAALPIAPPEVPIGLPSDLLRRRPDVRRAERQLAAETARIGVAKAEWFPKISLTGDFGAESTKTSATGSTRQPILVDRPEPAMERARFRPRARAGARANRRARGGARELSKAVLVSLQEAENAVVATRRSRTGTGHSPRRSPRIAARSIWPTVFTNTGASIFSTSSMPGDRSTRRTINWP